MSQDNQNMYSPTAKVGVEATFFGKVMTFFALAVFISAGGVYVSYTYFLEYFFANPAMMWGLYVAELAIIFTSRWWSRKAPLNRLLFAAFAFLSGATVGPLIGIVAQSPGGVAIIAKALLATGFMFTATAAIGWTTKINLSKMGGFLFMGLIGLIIVGVIGIFLPWNSQIEMVYAGFGVLLFTGYTAYDFQKLKHYPQDRYIDAALSLYLDMFNLFLFILRLILASRD